MEAPTPCKDREILRSRLRADLKVYRTAIIQLESHRGKGFALSHDRAERVRTAYEASRERLNAHIDAHGCEPGFIKMGPSNDHDLEIARAVDRIAKGRLDPNKIDEIIAALRFIPSSTENKFLLGYLRWRMDNPIQSIPPGAD